MALGEAEDKLVDTDVDTVTVVEVVIEEVELEDVVVLQPVPSLEQVCPTATLTSCATATIPHPSIDHFPSIFLKITSLRGDTAS